MAAAPSGQTADVLEAEIIVAGSTPKRCDRHHRIFGLQSCRKLKANLRKVGSTGRRGTRTSERLAPPPVFKAGPMKPLDDGVTVYGKTLRFDGKALVAE